MSELERRRLGPLPRVVTQEITLSVAAVQMNVSYRQAVRILKRYREEGDAGLVHRSCGRPSPRRKAAEHKDAVLELVQKNYADFGPTLASEKLSERDNLAVNRETLRRWLIEAGQWEPRTCKVKHRRCRKRKACFGEMVQMDGSPHAWFEERGEECFLMNLVDDATSASLALFSAEETTWAAMDALQLWVRRYGIPLSLYVDRKNVYVTDREQTREEQLAAMPALTQFGRACHKLGIRIIEAHSPQAKGRVERKHGVFQDRLIKDRLIKDLRLEGISDMEAANRFLPAWLDKNNDRFAVCPRSDVDLHRPVPKELDLRTVFCIEEERSLGMDFTVRYNNQWMQVLPQKTQKDLPAPRSRIQVQQWRDGSLHLSCQGRELSFHMLDGRPERPKPEHRPDAMRPTPQPPTPQPPVPSAEHPWRKPRKASSDYIDPRQLPALVNDLAETYLGPLVYGG